MRYVLDTHAWIWLNIDSEKLSPRVASLLADTDNYEELILSSISLLEFATLVEKKRLKINCDGEEWMESALSLEKLRVADITPAIAWKATILPGAFNTDPADRIIVATARVEKAAVISKDQAILNYAHVKAIW